MSITVYEMNVAYHFKRDNVYSPWTVIGVLVTQGTTAVARYDYHYRQFGEIFERAAIDAGEMVRGTFTFLDDWRRGQQETNCVISPVINHITLMKSVREVTTRLYTRYVGSQDPATFGALAVMIKTRKHVPTQNGFDVERSKVTVEELKEAGLI